MQSNVYLVFYVILWRHLMLYQYDEAVVNCKKITEHKTVIHLTLKEKKHELNHSIVQIKVHSKTRMLIYRELHQIMSKQTKYQLDIDIYPRIIVQKDIIIYGTPLLVKSMYFHIHFYFYLFFFFCYMYLKSKLKLFFLLLI